MISLHAICGNEAVHAERFIRAFAPAVDEICLARAVGESKPDETISICERVALEVGVALKWTEYRNKTPFPHVDDFASARNAALDLTSGDIITWADFDDIVTEETAQMIRICCEDILSGKFNITRKKDSPEPYSESGVVAVVGFAKYDLSTQGESAMRERIFTRAAHPRWRGVLHENLIESKPSIRISIPLSWIHEPLENKGKDPKRNLRILTAATDLYEHYTFERAREEWLQWNHSPEKTAEQQNIARRWLTMALADGNCLPPRRYQGILMLAALDRWTNPEHSRHLLWDAIRLMPEQRDAYALLAEIELESRRPTRALCVWLSGIAQRKPAPSGFQTAERLYGWAAADLLCRVRRACGEDPQPALDAQAEKLGGYKIALLHATRGRARKAMATRAAWHEAAHEPATILHIFASDDDDPCTEELEAMGALVLRNSGQSCVSAWNLAAEHAAALNIPILVQLSDDWAPCMNWDFFVAQSIRDATEGDLGSKPICLRVSDGAPESNGGLMCMAILTLARYRQQGHLFAPEYFGVFSDNEYTYRAEKDGVVLDAKHIQFRHLHPAYGKGSLDATYARQNDAERYREGFAIFRRRNPDAISSEPKAEVAAR
jgi:hypothetical protein